MKTLILITLVYALLVNCCYSGEWLHLTPPEGQANGKKIVLVAGDEEYRSEESCPMLAKILSQKHGFECTVLFSINPEGGYVDPNYQKNTPGCEALDQADLLIIGTRFRQLPQDQLVHFEQYLNAGKPVIGFRTATHAFTGSAKSGAFKWSEFGLKILGEKWVNHHGEHKVEGTRSVVEAEHKNHVVLNGVGEIFATTDVYGIANLDEKQAVILLRGQVTETLDPSSKGVSGPKNSPMMPIAWIRDYTSPDGKATGRAFCTTLGASVDFTDENLRRLIVNTALHLTQQQVPEKAEVAIIDPFKATMYGFIGDKEYFKKKNVKPDDYKIGHSPETGFPK